MAARHAFAQDQYTCGTGRAILFKQADKLSEITIFSTGFLLFVKFDVRIFILSFHYREVMLSKLAFESDVTHQNLIEV